MREHDVPPKARWCSVGMVEMVEMVEIQRTPGRPVPGTDGAGEGGTSPARRGSAVFVLAWACQ
ncbi:hypothetical protein GCM10010389_12250 [Streptomyces echinoruber]|uniref:Uncharacterized protein n=1 Tax=Streptomyces echinoruber TaxID=68898 RepID=A0A918QWZ9_9ACTN|nr:hypothetical protein GCM10010389_12250 [Streptomyces echinoruber]